MSIEAQAHLTPYTSHLTAHTSPPPMPHILEVDGVFLTFGLKKILQRVYLKAETGKVTGLLGRNGTGKSSLLKVIYGEF
ncbi:hypothetical protein GCM10023091_09420 [Ravibacter arvi]|uniref:ABC transporter domain-containing protein n=2 Tax=Ravibacter arvi TaxID=2051041 RepID=A0ABP8LSP3_9BACT